MKNSETLIISLIRNDLINYKLVGTLNKLGLFAADYYLSLGDTIFDLMGFAGDEYSDTICELYNKEVKKVLRINIQKSDKALNKLAVKIYLMLQTTSPRSSQSSVSAEEPPQETREVRTLNAA